MNRWLVALSWRDLVEGSVIEVKVLPIEKYEEPYAVEVFVKEGAHFLYTFTRPVELHEIADILSAGGSVIETFSSDIEKMYDLTDPSEPEN